MRQLIRLIVGLAGIVAINYEAYWSLSHAIPLAWQSTVRGGIGANLAVHGYFVGGVLAISLTQAITISLMSLFDGPPGGGRRRRRDHSERSQSCETAGIRLPGWITRSLCPSRCSL